VTSKARNKHKGNNPYTTLFVVARNKHKRNNPYTSIKETIHFSLSSTVASKIVVILGGASNTTLFLNFQII
jgi:hypothetical protein